MRITLECRVQCQFIFNSFSFPWINFVSAWIENMYEDVVTNYMLLTCIEELKLGFNTGKESLDFQNAPRFENKVNLLVTAAVEHSTNCNMCWADTTPATPIVAHYLFESLVRRLRVSQELTLPSCAKLIARPVQTHEKTFTAMMVHELAHQGLSTSAGRNFFGGPHLLMEFLTSGATHTLGLVNEWIHFYPTRENLSILGREYSCSKMHFRWPTNPDICTNSEAYRDFWYHSCEITHVKSFVTIFFRSN